MKYRSYKLICVALLLCYMQQGSAEDKNTNNNLNFNNLLNLELDSLLDVRYITVASKLLEASPDAGGSVTKYTADDISKLGYYTLSDLADITPGYHSHTHINETSLGTRGFRGNEFQNNKHLLLIDGIPYHNLKAWKVPVEYSMPLYFADKVQFLHGPGSALYGANAFYGVVEIDPISPSNKKKGTHISTLLRYGDPFSQQHLAVNLLNNGTQGDTTMSASVFNTKASAYDASGINPASEGARLWDNQKSKFLFLKHKFDKNKLEDFSLGLIYSEKKAGTGELTNGYIENSNKNITEFSTLVPYLKFEKDWSDKLNTNAHIRFNRSKEKGELKLSTNPEIDLIDYQLALHGYGGQFEVGYNISGKTNILTGIDYDKRYTRSFPNSYLYEDITTEIGRIRINTSPTTSLIEVFGLYGQLHHEADFLHGTILNLGGRFTKSFQPKMNYTNFSPKLSLVQRLREDLNVKFLYGKSFRAPSYNEIDRNLEREDRLTLNEQALSPELLESFEVGLVYHKPKFTFNINFYKQKLEDAIERMIDSEAFPNGLTDTPEESLPTVVITDNPEEDSPTAVIDNSEETLNSKGVEISTQHFINKQFNLKLGY